ncbi:MAG: amidohydrolase family protein [Thermomicrobiales bacterium]
MTIIQPLADLPIDPAIAALPKADLHVHAEAAPRLDRVIARRAGRPVPDLRETVRALLDEPPGMPRLIRMSPPPQPETEILDAAPENFIARLVDLLEEGAADGAILVEVRFGGITILRPDFMPLFREAERRVQAHYPRLRAEAIIVFVQAWKPEQIEQSLAAALRGAREGLAGADFISSPYDREADWTPIYRWAERAAAAGLGITVHAGEFSTANLAAALRVPGVTRLGHAVYAARDPRLLDEIARRGITVECSLTCNVLLGATASYETHPIRRFMAHGIPVTLNTDDPVRVGTTIGREYAIAAALGFSRAELLACTRNAIQASFTTAERRIALLDAVT